MPKDNLRQLSRQYARGRINRSEYRRRRRDLIDSIQRIDDDDTELQTGGFSDEETRFSQTAAPPTDGN